MILLESRTRAARPTMPMTKISNVKVAITEHVKSISKERKKERKKIVMSGQRVRRKGILDLFEFEPSQL